MRDPNPGAAKPGTRRLPRFRLSHMLVLCVVVAIGIVAVRNSFDLGLAESSYRSELYSWLRGSGEPPISDLLGASARLDRAEQRTWLFGAATAAERRKVRLVNLILLVEESTRYRDAPIAERAAVNLAIESLKPELAAVE